MVRLYEYEAKNILNKYGIKTPKRLLLTHRDVDKLDEIEDIFHYPLVLKAQVLHGRRARSGLVKIVKTQKEFRHRLIEIFDSIKKIGGQPRVLIEEYIQPKKEYMLSITTSNSRYVKGPILLFGRGGVDIEERREVYKIPINYIEGPNKNEIARLLKELEVDKYEEILTIIDRIYKLYKEYDCRLIEINPLTYTDIGYIALDARISIDDNSAHKHIDINERIPIEMDREATSLEKAAYKIELNDYRGISFFIEQDTGGEGPLIGFHGIGGGGALIGLDILLRRGFRVANYSDTSGNPPASKIYRIAKIILSIPNIEAYVLISPNIANQEMWYTALGLVKAFREELSNRPGFPIAILWGGNKASEASRILVEKTRDLNLTLIIHTVDPVISPDGDIYGVGELADELMQVIRHGE